MNKLFLISMILVAALADVTVEDSVYVLDDSNFAEFVAKYENVFVEFYAPWCGHCKTLAPEYSAAAEQVKDIDNLKLAKVDATEAKELANTYGIRGFPTLKFFKNGAASDYQGGRTKQAIVDFCLKKSGPAVVYLPYNDALTAQLGNSAVNVVFFGAAESAAYAVYNGVASSYDEVTFAHAPATVGAENNAADGSVVLFKTFDEKRNDLAAGFTAESLKAFVDTNSVPNVLPFNDKAIELVFHKQTPTVFLFNDDSKDGAADADAVFNAAAVANKGKGVIFSVSKPSDGSGNFQKLADYIGADTAATPVISLVKSGEELDKYKFVDAVTVENLSAFVDNYNAGKLTKFLKSADAPATNDEPVKVIVGTTFNDIVINNDKDVLVEFYAPWCGHCKTLDPKYTEAATKIAGNPNVVLAKCDATANEVPGVGIKGFPTLKFWPGNAKTSPPVDFEGQRETEDIIAFMKSHATKDWVETDAAASKDDL